MNGTAVVALVVFAVCVLGVGFSIYRTRTVVQRNRRRAAARQAEFSQEVSSLLANIKSRKAQGLPYDDLVAGYLGTQGTAPGSLGNPAPAPVAASAPLHSAPTTHGSSSDDMTAFFAHTSAANPLVQPEPTRLGIPEPTPSARPASNPGAVPASTPAASPASEQNAGSWLDLLASQTLDTLSRTSIEAEAIVSSQRADSEKAALLHQVLTTALGQLPLAHLAMVRDAGSPTPPPGA